MTRIFTTNGLIAPAGLALATMVGAAPPAAPASPAAAVVATAVAGPFGLDALSQESIDCIDCHRAESPGLYDQWGSDHFSHYFSKSISGNTGMEGS